MEYAACKILKFCRLLDSNEEKTYLICVFSNHVFTLVAVVAGYLKGLASIKLIQTFDFVFREKQLFS